MHGAAQRSNATAFIVFNVRDHHQTAPPVGGFLHFLDGGIHGAGDICSKSIRSHFPQMAFDFIVVMRKALDHCHRRTERHELEFVLTPGEMQQYPRRSQHRSPSWRCGARASSYRSVCCRHAGAGVDQHSNADRGFRIRQELADFLLYTIFLNNEVPCLKTIDKSSLGIKNGSNNLLHRHWCRYIRWDLPRRRRSLLQHGYNTDECNKKPHEFLWAKRADSTMIARVRSKVISCRVA